MTSAPAVAPGRIPTADERLAALVAAFWRAARRGVVNGDAIEQLCARASGEAASAATEALFGGIVEPLSDAFTARGAQVYVETFARAIDCVRRLPAGERLHRELLSFGLADAAAVAARGRRLLEPRRPEPLGAARTFVVLSRVTLGADVAIVTPILDALLETNPHARAVFLAPELSRGIVAGHPRVEFRAVSYARRGDLAERLNAWLPLLDLVRAERAACAPGACVVVDPDSRLTQLGLLPLATDADTRVFPSRTLHIPRAPRLGQLAAAWAQDLTRAQAPPRARLWLTAEARAWAARLRGLLGGGASSAHGREQRSTRSRSQHPLTPTLSLGERGKDATLVLRERGKARGDEGETSGGNAPPPLMVAVHFGVGGNERKRLGEAFELELLRGLAASGATVLLARGVSTAELAQTAWLTTTLRQDGAVVLDVPAGGALDALVAAERRPQVVTWQADSGAFCALVEASDLYLGYDSAGQHVAAAAGTPAVTLFVTSAGSRHLRRWSPHGRRARVLAVPPGADQHAAAAAVLRLVAC